MAFSELVAAEHLTWEHPRTHNETSSGDCARGHSVADKEDDILGCRRVYQRWCIASIQSGLEYEPFLLPDGSRTFQCAIVSKPL